MDKISLLPDDVIIHILSFIPTKHAVATSILSSRWVNLWTFLPFIDLDDSLYLNPLNKDSSSSSLMNIVDFHDDDDNDDDCCLRIENTESLEVLKLSFVGDLNDCTGEIYVNIGGKALKSLELELRIDNIDDCDAMVVIDAPHLEYLRLKDGFLALVLVEQLVQ
ncbi:F-box/RNI-like superfamily protein [Tanacetum coccineum]